MSVRVNGSGLLSIVEGTRFSTGRTAQGGVKGALSWTIRQLQRTLRGVALFQKDEWTNPPAADVDAFLLDLVGDTDPHTITTMNGVAAAGLNHPRNVTVTTTGADTEFTFPFAVVVTGELEGEEVTETITFASNESPGTKSGSKIFDRVTQVELPAYTADASVSVGFGAGLGTTKAPKAVGGIYPIIREVAAGALATNGTLNQYGLYTPGTAPNDTNDYAIYYETDLSSITGRLAPAQPSLHDGG